MTIWLYLNQQKDKAIVEKIQNKIRKAPVSPARKITTTPVRNTFYIHHEKISSEMYQNILSYTLHISRTTNPKFILSIKDIKQDINDRRFDEIDDIVVIHRYDNCPDCVCVIGYSTIQERLQSLIDTAVNSLCGPIVENIVIGEVVGGEHTHNASSSSDTNKETENA